MKITDRSVRDSAPSPLSMNLASINWKRVDKNIRCLQNRIVKAQQSGNRRRAKSLYRMLAMSYSAKVLRAKQAFENQANHIVSDRPS
jgi:RNA-directed DNA polymerase